MTSPSRRPQSSVGPRARLAALVAAAVAAGVLSPVALGTAAAAVLPAPAVVGPVSDRPVLKDVVLDWEPVPGAVEYAVQVGTDEQWSDDPTLSLKTTATRTALPAWLPHASYVWRVAARTEAGQGRWSAQGTFTRGWHERPTPLSPLADHDRTQLPEFRWTPVPSASEYQVQLSNSPGFDDGIPTRGQQRPFVQACFTTRTSVTPYTGQAQPRNDGAGDCMFSLVGSGADRLYWRVRALDHVVDGKEEVDTTPVVDEGISHLPPAKMDELDTSGCPDRPEPVGSLPTASASPSAVPASPSPSASGTPTASASASPTPVPGKGAGPSTGSGEPEHVPCEPAHDVEKGAWSATTGFSYDMELRPDTDRRYERLPLVQTLPLPTDLCTPQGVCRDFPTLRWTAVPGADWYRVYVALDDAYSNIQQIAETPGTSWTPTTQYRDNGAGAAYRYVVQPCTITGSTPGCGAVTSTPKSFRKASPRVALAGPADGALVGGSDLVLSWQPHSQALRAATGAAPTSEAYAYRVQLAAADDEGFSDPVVDEVLDGALCGAAPGRPATGPSPVQSCGSAAAVVERDPATDVVTWTPPAEADDSGALRWRVQAVDASGHRLPWSAARTLVLDRTAPTFTVTPAVKAPTDGALTLTFDEPVRGISGQTVSLAATTATVTATGDRLRAVVRPAARMIAGATYTLSVGGGITDLAGNPVAPATVTVTTDPLVDSASRAMAWSGTWRTLSSSNAVGGSYARSVPTAQRPTIAAATVSGRGVQVTGCVGPGNGVIEVWHGTRRLSRVDTYRPWTACGVVLTRPPLARPGNARVHVRGVGAKHARSTGTAVGIDAITAIH